MAQGIQKTTLVHYMPWYASKPVSGQWGWHWTMNHFDPDKLDANGQPSAASHYRPLIGLYDSNDPDVLECHVQLMKLAGIDGVIVDWYGMEDFRDYGEIHRNTRHLVKFIRRAGLQFAICYEDQSVKHLLEGNALKNADDVVHGRQVLAWLEENFFADRAYVKIDGKPVLLIFGPQHFKREQWVQITADLKTRPLIYALPHLSKAAGADGAFGWPPVHGGKEITPDVWRPYLKDLYSRGETGESIVAPVFAKFHDIYKQAGLHDSYGFIDDRQGQTFQETLDLAWNSASRLIQVATWNDYGEGTMVEPTTKFGYRYLEAIQQRIKTSPERSLGFGANDLKLPVMLYSLRKQNGGNEQAIAKLNEASELLLDGQCSAASAILNQLASENR